MQNREDWVRTAGTLKKQLFLRYRFFLLLVLLLASGCVPGPKQLKDGHLAYNETVRLASDQELLLNIVRLRYLDTIEFMSMRSISAQLSFAVTVGGSVGEEAGFSTNLGIGEVGWANRPTFTFMPQRGSSFAHMVTTSVPLTVLADLAAADWNVRVLSQLLIQDINGHLNLSGNVSQEFLEVVRMLDELQGRNELSFGTMEAREALAAPISASRVSGADLVEAAKAGFRFDSEPGSEEFVLSRPIEQPVLSIPQNATGRTRLFELLHLLANEKPYVELHPGMVTETLREDIDSIVIDTRSILDAIAYLAGGVEVPEYHVNRGWVQPEWPTAGARTAGLSGLFRVRVSESRPESSLAVRHRGWWFYLADDDIESRLTFLTLAELLRLALSPGGDTQEAPVLTLPVGR